MPLFACNCPGKRRNVLGRFAKKLMDAVKCAVIKNAHFPCSLCNLEKIKWAGIKKINVSRTDLIYLLSRENEFFSTSLFFTSTN